MEIIVGKTAGFCYGVKRAVEGAKEEITKFKDNIYCLGEIVHNKQVIRKLENLGIKCVETIQEAKGTVLIRAHGVSKEVYDLAKKMNIKIEDYTCPNVLKIHKIVEKYNQDGYFIFLLGAKNHPENIGTISHCEKNCYIIEKEEEIQTAIQVFQETNKKRLLLIAQTTFSLEKFEKMEKILKANIDDEAVTFVVKNTICRATELRQKETEEISKKVDAMVIVGGKNSSNTKKLYEIANKYCPNTVLVETVQELKTKIWGEKVGIMAGASTPKESIEEVINFFEVNG